MTDLWENVRQNGYLAMDFLHKKVDNAVVDRINGSESLLEFCLSSCLEEKLVSEPKSLVLLATTVKRILTVMNEQQLQLSSNRRDSVFDFVFRYWDSNVDAVCHEVVDTFGLTMDLHRAHCEDCRTRDQKSPSCQFGPQMVNTLFSSQSVCRSRFRCILYMMKNFDCQAHIGPEFRKSVYDILGNSSLSVVASNIITADYAVSPDAYSSHVNHIADALVSPDKSLRTASRDRLLPILMKSSTFSPSFFMDIMAELQRRENSHSRRSLEAILSLCKMLVSSQSKTKVHKTWADFVAPEVMKKSLLYCSSDVRIAAWGLLCDHPKKTTPFSLKDLELIKLFLVSNFTEQSPAIRQKIFSNFKLILIRLAESWVSLKKFDQAEQLKEEYLGLIRYVHNLSFESLDEKANFCRRLTALNLIDHIHCQEYLIPNGKTGFRDTLDLPAMLTIECQKKLIGVLDDSFQLCQSTALELLKKLKFREKIDFSKFREETTQLMLSLRSHNTLSAGYRFKYYAYQCPNELIGLLTDFLDRCKSNLISAQQAIMNITVNPIHSILNTVAALLESVDFSKLSPDASNSWREFIQTKLLPICFEIANVVQPVVHSLSPEGYIPEEMLNGLTNVQLQAEISQLLLACCWRAHRHVSSILSWAVTTLFPLEMVTPSDVEKIAQYYWLQLTECKHCGAFESAVEGFTSLSTFLWKCEDPALPKPIDWMETILNALNGENDMDHLCSTRRSAGLPYLMVVLMSTEPIDRRLSGESVIEPVMNDLLDMEERSLTCKIHSLNILKAIFASSSLGERIAFALEDACQVAVSGCSSTEWPIRNSSAQLAAALRCRIFGVAHIGSKELRVNAKNRQSAYEFFSKYPSLYDYLYQQLITFQDEFSVYPILIFLSHIYPSISEQYSLAPFVIACLKVLLWCKAEKLRELAAATTVAISKEEDLNLLVRWITSSELINAKQNHVHSVLLLMEQILEDPRCSEVMRDSLMSLVENLVKQGHYINWCDYNVNKLFIFATQSKNKIFPETQPSDLWLAKRPLMMLYLKYGREIPDDITCRMEMYRWLVLKKVEYLDDIHHPVLSAAIKDLPSSEVDMDRDCRCILELLLQQISHLNHEERKLLENAVKKCIEDEKFTTGGTAAIANHILFLISPASLDKLFTFAEEMIDDEDDDARHHVLEVCLTATEKNGKAILACEQAVKILSRFLYDEDQELREKVSSSVSIHVLGCSFQLNPAVCIDLLRRKTNFVTEVETSQLGSGLFDPCSGNQFAEHRSFGDADLVCDSIKEFLN